MVPSVDVAIIGAGPAGSAAAGFLARRGHAVTILEKEHFPRFHVGESLLPLGVAALDALGVDLATAPYALRKSGAIVLCEESGQSTRISFAETLPGLPDHAYQVERASFDHALANHAGQLGAEIRYGERVTAVREDATGIEVESSGGSLRARFLIDASGLASFLCRRRKARAQIRGLGKCASFVHFTEVDSPRAAEVFRDGDIVLILAPEGNWSWVIPLPGNRISLGLVHRSGTSVRSAREELARFRDGSGFLAEVLGGATMLEPVHRCSDYSYYNQASATDRTVCLGDAHAFLDPVFSTGVSLALHSAKHLAEAMEPSLETDHPLQLEDYFARMKHGYTVFERILERFYRKGWAHTTFFADSRPAQRVRELNTIFAGDVWRDDNEWQNLLLRSRRSALRLAEGQE